MIMIQCYGTREEDGTKFVGAGERNRWATWDHGLALRCHSSLPNDALLRLFTIVARPSLDLRTRGIMTEFTLLLHPAHYNAPLHWTKIDHPVGHPKY